MGTLFASGWTLDDVVKLTWSQLSFVVYATQLHKGEILKVIQEAIVLSMGGKIDKKKKKRSKKKGNTDMLKLNALRSMGIAVTQEPTTDPKER